MNRAQRMIDLFKDMIPSEMATHEAIDIFSALLVVIAKELDEMELKHNNEVRH